MQLYVPAAAAGSFGLGYDCVHSTQFSDSMGCLCTETIMTRDSKRQDLLPHPAQVWKPLEERTPRPW